MRETLGLKRFFIVCAVAVCALMGRGALAADASCGVNVFNPMILTEADFSAGNGNSYSGQWNKDLLNAYLSTSDFGFDATKKYSLRYKMRCGGDNGSFFFVLKNSEGRVFGPGNGTSLDGINVCDGNTGEIEIKINDVEKVVAVEAYGDGTGPVQISEIMLGLSSNINTAESFIQYSPCIKLATTKMNETRMSAIENRLGDVRTMINVLITKMQTNSENIGGLQVDKQTRPNSSCPADKKCLLVKDMQNNDNWYEIVDCNENAFFSNMGASFGGGSNPFGSEPAGKWCDNDYNGVGTSRPDCAEGQWGHLYANGMVYGEAKAVSIEESVGTVVTLPNNVTAGDTCVCRVTGYAPLVSGAYANSVTGFTTDRWVVGGRISEHYASLETLPEATDAACVNVCGFEEETYGLDRMAAYYVSISNSCSSSVDQAHICNYHSFLGTLGGLLGRDGTYLQTGSWDVNSNGWYGCQNAASGSVWANHCMSGDWVTHYSIGWAWGRGGFVTVPDGVAVGDVIKNLSSYDFSLTASGAHNAIVCTVDGYKNGTGADQSVNFDAAVVYRIANGSSENFVSGVNNAATSCAEWSQHADEMKLFYGQLAGMCSAD